MKYDVVKASNIDILAMRVTDKINDGWACAGGVFIKGDGQRIVYFQSMVKI